MSQQVAVNINLAMIPGRRLFGNPQRALEPYVAKGQMVADLGCGKGYYTLALAECVGPEGKVYAVDFDEKCSRALEKEVDRRGYRNIEVHTSSAYELSFIKEGSVDFILANGLLCSMPSHREEAVSEIKRILKSTGKAYLSLGAPAPLGFVNKEEWKKILEGFRVEQKGGFFAPSSWALVSAKQQ
ncbi:MAG: class I SAM-dependent methyltransferase [Candidatus Hodarchaeota archaeon]